MRRNIGRGLTLGLATAVIVGMLPASATAEPGKGAGLSLPGLKQPKPVPVKPMAAGGTKRKDDAAAHRWKGAPKVTWPAAGSTDIDLNTTSGPGSQPVKVAKAPVAPAGVANRLQNLFSKPAPSANGAKVKVTVADRAATRKAGVDGVLLRVDRDSASAAPGGLKVAIDYSKFRGAYGGDWAARLRFVELPACALTTPQKPECRGQKPLPSDNNTETGSVSAEIAGAPQPGPVQKTLSMTAASGASGSEAMALAVTADSGGSSGDYKATPLDPSGAWSAGGSTGSLSWNYPIPVPGVPGGLAPSVGLGYNSQAVDGRTAASNNQPSWVGDGWAYEPGFVERRYKSCEDDKTGGTNTTKEFDECWFNDNAVLHLGGKSTELVYDAAMGWHPENDSGEKVEKLTGASNGDNNGEHWKVTTPDGTQYFFGLNRLPGWKDNGTAADDPVTNSAWTVPVFGNQSGEPCYNASFASGWCQQAWRWQLDYVVDTHGDAMAYYWNTEKNNYGRAFNASTGKGTSTPYVRSGWLDHIDYGLRSDAVYTGKAMGQVKFDVSERCLTNCGTFDETNAANWPDTPFDQYCKDGDECKDQFAPTYWSRKRLTSITTKVLTGGVLKDVDNWALAQDFPASGDGVSTPMWLKSIQHTGKVGGSLTLPPVTFTGEQRPNRIDTTGDGRAPFIRLRMSQITTETGGTIGAYYSQPDCTPTTLPPADGTNTTRCFPVKWAFEGQTAQQDWFNSYVVTQVVEGDNLASTPDKVTSYDYLDGAAWTKSTDELTKAEDRTYSVPRGYGRVQTRTGAAADPKSLSETRYFRGIDGAQVKDYAGVAVTDRDQFAGLPRASATFNGDDTSKLLSATSATPWRSAVTATRTRAGLPDLQAYMTGVEKEETLTTVSGGQRKTALTRTFDSYGMVTQTSTLGDVDKTGDESCSTAFFARNTGAWLLNRVYRTEVVAGACGSAISRPADVISDNQSYFDGSTTLGAAPTKGDVTKVEQINGTGTGYDVTSTTPVADYDIYGRPLSTTDIYGKRTTTAYTPATGEVPVTTVVTNPLSHQVTTVSDPLRSQPLTVTDANNRVTTTAYDPFGRVTKIWTPTRPASTNPASPSYTFAYTIRNDGPNVVTTSALDHNSVYQTAYAFYDGLLRSRQSQTPSPDGTGRLISETSYDTRGLAWRTSGTFYATGKPEAVLVTGQELNYPASTDTLFDGAGRVTDVIAKRFGDETKRTTTSYTGDTTTVVPETGGTASTTVTDGMGRTTEIKQYTDAARTTSQSTTYAYNKRGMLDQVRDPSGAVWKFGYDIRGRQTHVEDPDKGVSDVTFDAGNRATDITNARGITLHTDYDELGRKTALKQGTTTLATWAYDTATGGKGKLAKATRWIDGKAYEEAVTVYNANYKPVTNQVTIPVSPENGGLAGTYKWTTSYNANTGQVMWVQHPAMGGLPAEKTVNTYTATGSLLDTVSAGVDPLISAMTYDHYGRATRAEYGEFAKHLWSSYEYDEHTGALTRSVTDRELAPQHIDDTRYSYDPNGNITSVKTVSGQDAQEVTDTQCFTLDALRQITEAWTAAPTAPNGCAAGPSAATVGGPDAYWTTYTYGPTGNRKTEVQHKTPSGPTGDITRTYGNPAAGKHTLTSVSQTGPAGTTAESYAYNETGNATSRKVGPAAEQVLEWDTEGHLAKTTQGGLVTSYRYDSDGNRVTRTDSSGTTMYLPGSNELKLAKDGTVTGTRYYSAGETTVAMRTGGKLTFLLADHHGTGTTQVDASTQAIVRRKTGLFGGPRGAQPTTWVGERGFVGGTRDADTGLTHLGAREYDPATGRFISVDPLMDLTDPLQLDGYGYSHNNPITRSDPTGLYDPEERAYCQANPTYCKNGKYQFIDPDRSLSADKDGKGNVTKVYDKQGVPHHITTVSDGTTADDALKTINDDLRRAGLYYDEKTGTGVQYLLQDEKKANKDNPETLGKYAPVKDADGNVVKAGTTADFVKVTWKNGKIVSVSTADATGSTRSTTDGKGDAPSTVTNKLANQADEVIFVAKDMAQAEDWANHFAGNPNVRVIYPAGNFDNRRLPVAPPKVVPKPSAPKAKGPKVRGVGLLGPFLAGIQAPAYVRDYGWVRGGWEMFKDSCDPLGLTDDQPDPFFPNEWNEEHRNDPGRWA
ncbi:MULTISPECIES: RHS repeat-associated core domain-containing protein [unclassified Streptomyces]|uniref:RHS repeat-associated core domain-containing protein n=1 Tax=unclassified Streptomyces TaxID=2593676 RepID=UPI002035D215|nr:MULTISPECIES: RHS repeat-associated core domain-containing protein [unclassified Streptomyces]